MRLYLRSVLGWRCPVASDPKVTYRKTKFGAGPHVTLSVWVNGAHTGTMTVRDEDPDETAVLAAFMQALDAVGATNLSVPTRLRHG